MKKTLSVNSLSFITIVSFYFSFMLDIKFWQFAFDKIEIDNLTIAFFAFSLLFFIFVPLFWFFSLITLPKIAKPLIILLLILSSASDYALRHLGIVINSEMVRNIMETNWREATDLLNLHTFFYILITGVVPAIFVYRTKIVFAPFKKEFLRRLFYCLSGLLLIGLIASVSYKEYASFGRNNREARYYVNTFNYLYALGRYYQKNRDSKREFVILDQSPHIVPDKSDKPRVVLLLVGETARAQNFSLNGYEKETNPLLSRNREIINFTDVTACGTATAVSLPCMFSQLTRSEFSVPKALYMQNLLDIAKRAGYDVVWKDNDDGCKKVCHRVSTIDAKEGNKQPYCFGDYCHDEILLDRLEERLGNLTKDTLIVMHMMGSHGPTYFKRYPDQFKKFQPSCDTANLQDCTQEQIINSYDNTILYTDYVIDSVIQILKKHPEFQTAMLYASDHGESLGENNIYLHGLPFSIAPDTQKKVPMILWLSEDAKRSLNINTECLRTQAATQSFSHDHYFHSVLRLLSINSTAYTPNLDIFRQCGN